MTIDRRDWTDAMRDLNDKMVSMLDYAKVLLASAGQALDTGRLRDAHDFLVVARILIEILERRGHSK